VRRFYFLIAMTALVPASAIGAEWYDGGTLHRSTIREWTLATPQNRLATAADWSASILEGRIRTKRELHERAVQLRACVDEASAGGAAATSTAAELAAACAVSMGWR